MTTLDRLEETIQDFIDECSEHERCDECPCTKFCSRFDFWSTNNPSEWEIEKETCILPS